LAAQHARLQYEYVNHDIRQLFSSNLRELGDSLFEYRFEFGFVHAVCRILTASTYSAAFGTCRSWLNEVVFDGFDPQRIAFEGEVFAGNRAPNETRDTELQRSALGSSGDTKDAFDAAVCRRRGEARLT